MAVAEVGRAAERFLLADVGGTRCRLALATAEGIETDTIRTLLNANHETFAEVLEAYLGEVRPARVCIAAAGPVELGQVSLTNGDWHFDAKEISKALDEAPVHLVNDLSALGHALADLSKGQKSTVKQGRRAPGQSVVLGMGTGFNICAVTGEEGGPRTALASEFGGMALSGPVMDLLRSELGDSSKRFEMTEHLFTGAGLAQLDAILSGREVLRDGARIVAAAADGEKGARAATILQSRALGLLCRDVISLSLPFSGLYLAGSVARALMTSEAARTALLDALDGQPMFYQRFHEVPVYLVTDDAAALTGCLAILRQSQGTFSSRG